MSSPAASPLASTGGGSAVPPSPLTKIGTAPSTTPPVSSPPPTSSPPPPASPSPVSAPPPSPVTVSPPPATAPPPPPAKPSAPPAVTPTVQSPPPPSNSAAPPTSSIPPVASPPPPTGSSPPPASSTPPITSPSPPPPTPVKVTPSPTAQPSSPPSNSTPPIVLSPPPSSTPSPPPPKLPTPSASPPPPPNAPSPKGSPAPAAITSGSPPSLTPPSTSPPPPQNNPSTTSHSPPPPSSESPSSSGGSTSSIAIGAAVAGLFVLALCGVLIWYIRKRKRRDGYLGDHYGPPPPGSVSYKSDGSVSRPSDQYLVKVSPSPPTPGHGSSRNATVGVPPSSVDTPGLGNSSWFTYEELAVATNGFSPQNVLGEGGFGCVYKGCLPDGQVVAVKQLKVGSGQGEREFRAEVEIISRVHHRHLVSLVGYCIADSQRLLVYDYVPNGTLEYHLHGGQRPVMDWETRMRIAVGAARGIAYLHEDCHPKIIHRDIKGSNILLDDRFEAQVSDFGLAKLASDTNTHVTTRVMGTFGYMAPEYASSGKLTVRSDVFSFGVVLLELVTGRKPVDVSQPLGDESLVEWARPLLSRALEEGNFEELADPRLGNNFDGGEMFRMVEAAAVCVRHSARRRPGMGQVVRALESNAAIADLNNGVKPGESTMYNSAQYSADIRRFRRMAFGSQSNASDFSEVTSEYDTNLSTYSNEFRKSKESEAKQTRHWKSELGVPSACGSESPSSCESETRPINRSRFYRDETSEKSSGEASIPINFKSLTGR